MPKKKKHRDYLPKKETNLDSLKALLSDGADTPWGAAREARSLFFVIVQHHGEAVAKKMFTNIAATWNTKTEQARQRGYKILKRYDDMPEPNVMELARQLSEDGLGTVATVDHRIRELLRKRKKAIAEGTWCGPGNDPFEGGGETVLKSDQTGDEPTEAEWEAALAIMKTKRRRGHSPVSRRRQKTVDFKI
jgi:hypothetical protein